MEQEKIKDYLLILKKIPEIENYEDLGYTLQSVIRLIQTALVMEIEYPELAEHDRWDIYNLFNLLKTLIPQSELELLDILKKKTG